MLYLGTKNLKSITVSVNKYTISLAILSLFSLTTLGQPNNIQELENSIANYFELDYETLFTHLDKTIFFEGEEIWFKTYSYDIKRQKPFISSTNIYSSIYDQNGKLIKKKVYAAKNGMAQGNFKIDSTYSSGTYYFKTSTNWMKNFALDYSHMQKIQILRDDNQPNIENKTEKDFDLQILPEGGHIIQNAINSVGFKTVDAQGKSVKVVSGKVVDSNNNIITVFKSNLFGLGKFFFRPEKGKSYFCEITLETGETLSKPILNIEKKGLSIIVDNNQKDNVIIKLNTNKNSLPSLINKTYYLIVHRDGFFDKVAVHFAQDKRTYQYKIGRKFLKSGVNIITLIDHNGQPILERVIFNSTNSPIANLEVSEIKKEKDSTLIKLKTNLAPSHFNFSVSVLPHRTQVYNNNTNIISSFLINPYINGHLENPSYYFDNISKETIFNLDLLLLTQGWSKYSWNTIFNHPPNINYNFETGFTIKGKLNNYKFKNSDKIILQSTASGIFEEIDLNEDGFFSIDKLFLTENSQLSFTLKHKNGSQTRPNVYYNIYPQFIEDKIKPQQNIKAKKLALTSPLYPNFDKSIFQLDSINIEALNVTKPKNNPYGMKGAKHISFEDTNDFTLVTDIIRINGFDVINNGFDVQIESRRAFNFRGSLSPLVILDYVSINNQLDMIANLRVSDIEEMFISKTSNINASAAGVIHIFTKRGKSKYTKSPFNNSELDFGFSIAKKYYTPFYNKLDSENFNKMAVLHWLPNLSENSNGEVAFKIPNYFYDKINLYIEGMNENGNLISKIKTISIQ